MASPEIDEGLNWLYILGTYYAADCSYSNDIISIYQNERFGLDYVNHLRQWPTRGTRHLPRKFLAHHFTPSARLRHFTEHIKNYSCEY